MIRAYHQPTSLSEALYLVAHGGTPVAGATALYTAQARRNLELVDLSQLGLSEIEVSETEISIGAMVTLTSIVESALPGMEGALLRRASNAITSRPLRNAITVGGNIAHIVYWADLPVVLLALDAKVEVVRDGKAPALISIGDCVGLGRGQFHGGLITRVVVPRRPFRSSFGYERFSRVAGDYSMGTVAVAMKVIGAEISDVTIAVGAIQNRPFRADAVEAMLKGQRPDAALFAQAGDLLQKTAHFGPNFRARIDFRRKLISVLAKRALTTAYDWAVRED